MKEQSKPAADEDVVHTNSRLQHQIITHLLKHGSLKVVLPDGVTVEMGVNKISDDGVLRKAPDYSWVIASRDDRMACLDSFNLGLRFADNGSTILFEDSYLTDKGEAVKRVEVI